MTQGIVPRRPPALPIAAGWVALLHPLTPGTHTIVIRVGASTIMTTIVVEPGQ